MPHSIDCYRICVYMCLTIQLRVVATSQCHSFITTRDKNRAGFCRLLPKLFVPEINCGVGCRLVKSSSTFALLHRWRVLRKQTATTLTILFVGATFIRLLLWLCLHVLNNRTRCRSCCEVIHGHTRTVRQLHDYNMTNTKTIQNASSWHDWIFRNLLPS